MEKRSVGGYVYAGTAVRYLMDCNGGELIFEKGAVLENIDGLSRRLLDYELHVTWRVAANLRALSDEWRREQTESPDESQDNRVLTQGEAEQVRRAAMICRETLLAEAAGKIAYIAEDKRYTVEKLTGDMRSLFVPDAFDELPAIAQDDFVSAGRAVAFMLPTAAAFHMLRGTEAALRDFYSRLVRRGRIPEPRMWGPIIVDLKRRSSPPPELLTTTLDSLRKHFRNPTQHPEKTYDIDEAQDLLASAIDAVNQMHRHLRATGR
ncbi:hypothetical protein [Cellulomonas hominis]|uniref:hypothetical protein n=1 Tax=Cellulomonas hominis TaxID=156981 RepID=UPI001BD116CA|nr:hypothetical protein [Cellulomonas hominis]